MKTFVKICCAVLVIGAVLWGVGFAMGGRPLGVSEVPGLYQLERAVERATHRWDYWDDYDHDYDNRHFTTSRDDYAPTDSSGAGSSKTLSAEDYDKVRRIKLELGAGEFQLREANEHEGIEPFSVVADGVMFRRYNVGFSGNEWKAELECNRLRGNDDPVIIYLPAGTVWSEFDVSLGAGGLAADAVYADKFELSIGAGGAEMYIDSPKIDVEIGAGGATLTLPGTWDDYGYDAECGLGGISVNGDTLIGGIGEVKRSGSRMLDLEVAAGGLEINTIE